MRNEWRLELQARVLELQVLERVLLPDRLDLVLEPLVETLLPGHCSTDLHSIA